MAIEIERKFLVKGSFKEQAFTHHRIVQGYLCIQPGKTVRIRIYGDKGFITIKGASNHSMVSRFEWEKEISVDEATSLLNLCDDGVIDKTRYLVRSGSHTFEVDEFEGANKGLIMAEVELKEEQEPFISPAFIGEEVTHDSRYYNSQLLTHPFSSWERK
ncbi:MAG: CYTH domain-containing protein [Bacteroidaceae bacterium]|nr:CYTH domain-containing protein [Bacteroidaceae bacterium]